MILIENFEQVLLQIEKERGIEKSVLVEAIKAALVAACKKKFHQADNLEVTIDEKNGETNWLMLKSSLNGRLTLTPTSKAFFSSSCELR